MGVKGLMTYMMNRAHLYLEPQELSDMYLVIDGGSISHMLYEQSTLASGNGSEYEKFADFTEQFFDELLKCNIQPLVIFDGGWEPRKLPTIMARKREVLAQLYQSPSRHDSRTPVFLGTVFKSVVMKKNIRFAMATFEGDTAIAGIARILDCPVLSQDSDFFIFQGSYICYPWLGNYVVKTDRGYKKYCRIYRSSRLSEVYPGFDTSLLPIFATLLGNDFMNNRCFQPVFDTFFTPPEARKEFTRRRIEATFSWLCNRTLKEAVEAILDLVQEEDREIVSEAIRCNIQMYTSLPLHLLKPLGFSDSFIEDARIKFQIDTNEADKEFQLQGDSSCTLPSCFLRKFHEGVFPSHFMNYLANRLAIPSFQREVFERPPPILVALDLFKVIDKVLISLLEETVAVKPLIIGLRREANSLLEFVTFESLDKSSECGSRSDSNSNWIPIPTFLELDSMDLDSKRKTFNRILEIPDSFMEELPDNWKLYLSTVVYWMTRKDTLRNQLHLNTLLYCLMFSIIDEKLDFERDEIKFDQKYRERVRSIKKEGEVAAGNRTCDRKIREICESITENDCIMAATFFLYYSKYENEKDTNLQVSNVFLGFQYCLQNVNDINTLFGLPYAPLNVPTLCRERLVYNLYEFFGSTKKFEFYVSQTLSFSPGLLELFESLRAKVHQVLDTLQVGIDSIL